MQLPITASLLTQKTRPPGKNTQKPDGRAGEAISLDLEKIGMRLGIQEVHNGGSVGAIDHQDLTFVNESFPEERDGWQLHGAQPHLLKAVEDLLGYCFSQVWVGVHFFSRIRWVTRMWQFPLLWS